MNNLFNRAFITVDTANLKKELEIPIQRPRGISFKPRKGLWATTYIGEDGNICDWLNYIQKYHRNMMFNKACIFTLKKDANIYTIDNVDSVIQASIKYPSLHHKLLQCNSSFKRSLPNKLPINYEALLDEYDGVYINLENLPHQMLIEDGEFNRFDVNSLIISNIDSIEHYQSLALSKDENNLYSISSISEHKHISSLNPLFLSILEELKNKVQLEIENNQYYQLQENYEDCYRELDDLIHRAINRIYYQYESDFHQLNYELMCNGFYPIQVVMSQIVLSEQLRKGDQTYFRRYLNK